MTLLRIRPVPAEIRRLAQAFLEAHPDRDWTAREIIPHLDFNPYSQAAALRDELKMLADKGWIQRVALREDHGRQQARVAYRAYPVGARRGERGARAGEAPPPFDTA